MPTISNYEAMILQSRVAELQILAENQRDIMAVLSKEYRRIQTLLDNLELADNLKYNQLTGIQAELDRVMDDLYGKTGVWQDRRIAIGGDLEGVITDAMDKAASAGIEGKIKASVALLNEANPALIQYVPELFGGIKEDVLRVLMTRPREDGRIFSQRFWNLKNESDRVISSTLSSGLLQGKSARMIAKDLRPFLTYREGMTQKQVISRTITLARTEINNAFTEVQIQSAKREKWNKGIKWNLSASHPRPDICDIYASQDLYGLGDGIYPPDKVPVRHPRCLCFLTNVLASLDEVAQMLREDLGLDIPREPIVVRGTEPLKPEKPKKWNPKVVDNGIIEEVDYEGKKRKYQHYNIGKIDLKINLVVDYEKQIESITDALGSLPDKDKSLIKSYYSFRMGSPISKQNAYASYNNKQKRIDIWNGNLNKTESKGAILHELGHVKAEKLFGTTDIARSAAFLSDERGKMATSFINAYKNGGKAITEYDELANSFNEAFSEAYAKYYSTGKITAKGTNDVINEVQEWFEENLGKVNAIGDELWLVNK